ncbi:LTA synthase family protein [Weissella confusa]
MTKINQIALKPGVVKALIITAVSLLLGLATTFAFQVAAVNQGWGMTGQTGDGAKAARGIVWWILGHRGILYLSALWLAGFFAVLLTVFNRWYTAILIYVGLSVSLTLALYQKMMLRNEAILPSDVSELASAHSLLKMLDDGTLHAIIIAVAGFSLVFVLLIMSDWLIHRGAWRNQPNKPFAKRFRAVLNVIVAPVYNRRWPRVATVVVMAVLMSLPVVMPTKMLDTVYGALDNQPQDFASSADAAMNGPMLVFLKNANVNTVYMDEPAGYSEAKMAEIEKKYTTVAKDINATRQNSSFKGQTVIYLLSESLMNPERIPSITTNQPVVPNLKEIMSQTTSGLMVSSGFGGGTANMEYMSLTGMPVAGYNKKIDTPYTQMISHVKAAPSILSYFDSTASIHPFNGTFYNRKGAYKKLGMQAFYNTDSDSLGGLPFGHHLPGGGYISDEAAFLDLEYYIKKADDQDSQFVQLLTMQNHLPYPENSLELSDEDKITADVPDKDAKGQVETYLEGIHQTDKQLPLLLEKLNETSRPITLLFYGDHWPGIFTFVNQQKNPVLSHTAEYFIWQNDAAKEKNGTGDVSRPYASPSDFSSMMLQMSNMKVTPYFALQTEIADKVPAVANFKRLNDGKLAFVDAEGKEISESKLSKKQRDLLADLRYVQYDLSQGDGYLTTSDFFK